jgi:hypothetical protein
VTLIVLLLLTLQSVAVTVVDKGVFPLLVVVPAPVLSMLRMLVSTIFQVTRVVTSGFVPETSAFASNVIVSVPGPTVTGPVPLILVLIVRLVTVGHTVTVAAVDAVTVPSVAEICVVPTVVAVLEAVTYPEFAPTVATDWSDEVHRHLLVTFCWLPSLKVPVAVI